MRLSKIPALYPLVGNATARRPTCLLASVRSLTLYGAYRYGWIRDYAISLSRTGATSFAVCREIRYMVFQVAASMQL